MSPSTTPPPESFAVQAARWLTFGSAVTILVSIAASQILLALALATLLLSGEKLRMPRIWLPLSIFIAGTLVSLAFSGEIAAGLPQIRKFFVFGELLVVFSTLRNIGMIRALFLSWAGFACVTGIRGFVQFAQKLQQARLAGADSYHAYVGERITGFMSHWNTFSAQEMFALTMLGAFLFFAPGKRRFWVWILCAGLIAFAILLGETRAVWVGTAVAGLYLVWFWRPKMILLVPLAVGLAFAASLPVPVLRERFTSFLRPKKEVDSNQFRIITWRTGLHMIEAHPLLGLGPEGPNYHFKDYIPADVPRPLPSGWYGHLHNIYLQYAAERGIPTMLVMMWMLGQIIVDFWRGLRALPAGPGNRRFLLHGGIAVVLATLAEGFAEYNLGDSEVLTMFLVVVACGYLALERDIVME